jgi:predicted N-formylglutamate amidohydrolase
MKSAGTISLILTCEHGGNRVPARYGFLFKGQPDILKTHKGYDVGALTVARFLSKALAAPLVFSTETRLIIDQNRSLTNKNLFSKLSASLPPSEKQRLIVQWYEPHHDRIEREIRKRMNRVQHVLHCAIHSFTPVLHGQVRNADIGLLYDPASPFERSVVQSLRTSLPGLRIRLNYPYRGISDGLTRSLRRIFGPKRYCGIEIEINQSLLKNDAPSRRRICHKLACALQNIGPLQ